MDTTRSVTATFSLNQYDLDLTFAGTGNGEVTFTPSGVMCSSDCTESFDYGTMVTLTAVSDPSSHFAGWSGACTGTGDCVVTMNAAQQVTATYTLIQHSLTVTVTGNGEGSVISVPTGIDCGADCSELYNQGTVVVLNAVSGPASHFAGWSGACSGTSSCVVPMMEATAVTATFTRNTYDLDVTIVGTGNGSVTSVPAGIDCQGDCSAAFAHGTLVTLTAVPNAGSTFTGWSGACSGTGNCVVTIEAATQVTATFAISQHNFTVSLNGAGSGSVSSSPAGITCGADCAEVYEYGTVVTLTAVPAADSSLGSWGGDCAGTSGLVCTLTVTADTTVTITFVNGYSVFLPLVIRGN